MDQPQAEGTILSKFYLTIYLSWLTTLSLLTKNWRLLVGAEVVVGQVEEDSQLVGEERDEGLVVLLPHQPVGEHTETLVYPQPGHGALGIMVVPVGSQEALEHLHFHLLH